MTQIPVHHSSSIKSQQPKSRNNPVSQTWMDAQNVVYIHWNNYSALKNEVLVYATKQTNLDNMLKKPDTNGQIFHHFNYTKCLK